jgi:hypothetical protein
LTELQQKMRAVARGEPPKILDAIADVVLAYKPKPKSKTARKLSDKAEKIAKEK